MKIEKLLELTFLNPPQDFERYFLNIKWNGAVKQETPKY